MRPDEVSASAASAPGKRLSLYMSDSGFGFQVDGGEIVGSLKAILEVETGVPMVEQILSFNGSPLNDK